MLRMILRLDCNDYVRLRKARGAAIEVLTGRVWITEDGRAADRFLGPGHCYRVGGEGLVLIGTDGVANDEVGAEITLRPA
jgi:hypothetical protein